VIASKAGELIVRESVSVASKAGELIEQGSVSVASKAGELDERARPNVFPRKQPRLSDRKRVNWMSWHPRKFLHKKTTQTHYSSH
jgi:hypothetical protein